MSLENDINELVSEAALYGTRMDKRIISMLGRLLEEIEAMKALLVVEEPLGTVEMKPKRGIKVKKGQSGGT